MKKKIGVFIMALVLVISTLFAAGCSGSTDSTSSDNSKNQAIRIAALKGPTGMGMAKLMEDYTTLFRSL